MSECSEQEDEGDDAFGGEYEGENEGSSKEGLSFSLQGRQNAVFWKQNCPRFRIDSFFVMRTTKLIMPCNDTF